MNLRRRGLPTDAMPSGTATLMPRSIVATTTTNTHAMRCRAREHKHEALKLLCGRPKGRITCLARPSVRPSVRTVYVCPVRALVSKTKDTKPKSARTFS